jgi:hypothetical protein
MHLTGPCLYPLGIHNLWGRYYNIAVLSHFAGQGCGSLYTVCFVVHDTFLAQNPPNSQTYNNETKIKTRVLLQSIALYGAQSMVKAAAFYCAGIIAVRARTRLIRLLHARYISGDGVLLPATTTCHVSLSSTERECDDALQDRVTIDNPDQTITMVMRLV